jgi:hypothetical protein
MRTFRGIEVGPYDRWVIEQYALDSNLLMSRRVSTVLLRANLGLVASWLVCIRIPLTGTSQ